jgi:hypothetical protein
MRVSIVLGILALTAGALRADAQDCSDGWERFSSAPLEQIALPDMNVTYWRYRFQVTADSPVTLRIAGQFPHGRYMNFNVYDQETLDSTAKLTDADIVPDPGSVNPFTTGVARDAAHRDYTTWVVPKLARAPMPVGQNLMVMPQPIPGADPKAVELWYRIYEPDPAAVPDGGVAPPRISAFTDVTGATPAACPQRAALSAPLWRALGTLPPALRDPNIIFFAPKPMTMYANADTTYLLGRLAFKFGDVAVIRFKAPQFPDTASGLGAFPAPAEVRYWSLCLGGVDTRTSACLADSQAHLDAQGWETLVVGSKELEPRVRALGFDFLEKPPFLLSFVLYRHLLDRPGFAGALSLVPMLTTLPRIDWGTVLPLAAPAVIGDYAPRGRHCSEEDFFENRCGMFETASEGSNR